MGQKHKKLSNSTVILLPSSVGCSWCWGFPHPNCSNDERIGHVPKILLRNGRLRPVQETLFIYIIIRLGIVDIQFAGYVDILIGSRTSSRAHRPAQAQASGPIDSPILLNRLFISRRVWWSFSRKYVPTGTYYKRARAQA